MLVLFVFDKYGLLTNGISYPNFYFQGLMKLVRMPWDVRLSVTVGDPLVDYQ